MEKIYYIDMDNTLMDFSRDDLKESLVKMADPLFYKSLIPYDGAVDSVIRFMENHKVGIISGIADIEASGEYLYDIENYEEYFEGVKASKLFTLKRDFGGRLSDFISIYFIKQSYPKSCVFLDIRNKVLIDDNKFYVDSWRNCGGKAYLIDKKMKCKEPYTYVSLEACLNDIMINGEEE